MNILVTGCMGFIGSNLVSKLLNDGHSVLGFDNLVNPSLSPTDRMKATSGDNWQRFKFYKLDVTNTTQMLSILANEKIDAIVHLAALGSVPRSFQFPLNVVHANELGFVSVLHTANLLGIKQFIFASSSSIYGMNDKEVKTEGQEGFPLSPYALSKKTNECFAQVWCPRVGINFVGLRFFNVYGPGQLPRSPYSAVIPKFINEDTPIVFGDGKTVRDFTFVDDVCDAISLSLEFSKEKSTIVNVGKGVGVSLNALIQILEKTPTYEGARIGDIPISIANPEKAKKELGFVAKVSIAQGLDITKKYYEGVHNDLG